MHQSAQVRFAIYSSPSALIKTLAWRLLLEGRSESICPICELLSVKLAWHPSALWLGSELLKLIG